MDIRERALTILKRFGHRMSPTQTDRVLDIWDGAVKKDLKKSLPTIDTSKQDREREEREQENRKLTAGGEKRQGGFKRRGDRQEKKDTRPYNPYFWKVKYPDGTVWDYIMSPNGALQQKQENRYKTQVFTLDEWKKIHEDHTKKHGKADKEEVKKSGKHFPWGKQIPLVNRAEHMVDDTPLPRPAPVPIPQPQRRPEPAPQLKLTGHEMAAVRAGVALDKLSPGTDLTRMTIDQMRELAQQQTRESVVPSIGHHRFYNR